MESRWSTVCVEEIAAQSPNAMATGPFGSAISSKHFRTSGVPVIRGSNLSGEIGIRLNDNGLVFLDQELADSFERSKVRAGDLVFTCWGTVDQVGLIDNRARFETYVISNKQMKLTPDLARTDPLFLYYLFSSAEFRDSILASAIGSSVPGFNLGQLRKMRICLPPLAEQRAIAGVLEALDDKIEANRRMNATLEALVRALFKSWFVDFDPVCAKMEGRAPALAPDLAALFPDRLTDSPLGHIPEGWEVKGLLEVARLISGGTPKTDESAFWDGGIAWASAKDVSQCGQPFLIATERTISRAGLENSSTRLVPAKSTVVVARGATTGRFTMLGSEMAMNQTCYALNCQAGHDFWLNGLFANTIDALVNAAHGSVFDTITTRTIETARVRAPADAVRRAYEEIVKPTYGRLLLNLEQSQVLAQLRDLLLPKLLSGALRVRDAERMIGDAA